MSPSESNSTSRQGAFFDLDKTIIARSSVLAFATPFARAGLMSKSTLLKSIYSQLLFSLSSADADKTEKLRAQLSEMVAGWPIDEVKDVVNETLHKLIEPIIFEEALDLIEEHQSAGREVVIVSSSGEEVVRPIAKLLGVTSVIATRMRIEEGKYTGEIEYYAFGQAKADAIIEFAREHNIDLADSVAYSDSMTDVPMLSCVGRAYAVNPDKDLRRVAIEKGWKVLTFKQPVSIQDRLDAVPKKSLVIAGAGVAIVGLLALATGSRKKKSRTTTA
ncbi:MAG: HAD-IB family hydrolase [Actinobacteria bacterium]|nr:HAD-IB family hydrolase [Actinomycetota bacterium]